ncbi:ribosome recycling factor [Patescibacteria group bacterium]|nr:ribosome recycling factor [Patescibacteria group bacterium]
MHQEIIKKLKPNLEKSYEYLKSELASLQVGRATPGLIENLTVDCYNQQLPIKQLAAIQTPEPRMIIIRPWDKEIITQITQAIKQSSLGITPMVDEDSIRLNIPPLSEERRRELVKILQEKTEESRISIRRQREEIWRQIQDLERAKEISEDAKFRAKDEIQKIVDEYNKKIEELKKKKEEEIMKV